MATIVKYAALGMFVCGSALVGCGSDSSPVARHVGAITAAPPAPTPPAPAPAPASASPNPAVVACAGVAPPTQLKEVGDARDVLLVGGAVFFTSGSSVLRVGKDGKDEKVVFTSENLVHAYVDKTAMIVLEATVDAPDATTLRVISASPDGATSDVPEFPVPQDGAELGTTARTNFNAAGTQVFASDDTGFYLLADTADGSALVKVNKADPTTQTTLATSANVVTNPQISGGALWYVRDAQRVFKVVLPDDANGVAQGDPTEVFGVTYSSVNLAVNDTGVFFTAGTTLERRDLTGGSPATIFDAQQSKAPAPLGAAVARDGALFVPSNAPNAEVKNVIRSLKPGAGPAEEKFIACGRELVTSLQVDATSVVWAEQEKGVFIAPR
jgi:hypothetical protein